MDTTNTDNTEMCIEPAASITPSVQPPSTFSRVQMINEFCREITAEQISQAVFESNLYPPIMAANHGITILLIKIGEIEFQARTESFRNYIETCIVDIEKSCSGLPPAHISWLNIAKATNQYVDLDGFRILCDGILFKRMLGHSMLSKILDALDQRIIEALINNEFCNSTVNEIAVKFEDGRVIKVSSCNLNRLRINLAGIELHKKFNALSSELLIGYLNGTTMPQINMTEITLLYELTISLRNM